MIDVTVPASPSEDQAKIVEKNLDAMYLEINRRNLKATIFLTRDAVDWYGLSPLRILAFPNFELAISGDNSQ